MDVLGLELTGNMLKGAVVDTAKGELYGKAYEIGNIDDTSPHKTLARFHEIQKFFNWNGPVGFAFPAPVVNGIVVDSTHLDDSWVDTDVESLFCEFTSNSVFVINNADAAGLAEVNVGAGRDTTGTVIFLLVSTGVGSSMFFDGKLIPNTELGLIDIKGISAEARASSRVREEEGIKRKIWAKRLEFILAEYERIFHPRLFVIAGDIARKPKKVLPFIDVRTHYVTTELGDDGAIIGAALETARRLKQREQERLRYADIETVSESS